MSLEGCVSLRRGCFSLGSPHGARFSCPPRMMVPSLRLPRAFKFRSDPRHRGGNLWTSSGDAEASRPSGTRDAISVVNKRRRNMFSVLITGSSRGIGLELTKQFVTHHDPPDTVIATCRNPEAADELRSLVSRFNNVVVLKLDVNKIDTFPSLVERVDSIVGESGLNVLINNAGIISRKANLEEVLYDDYLNVLHTNTVAPVFLTQALLPLIKRAAAFNGDKDMSIKRAAVINMSSMMGSVSLTTRGYWGYSESKAALNQASRLLSSNVSMLGILVVDLHPGWVKTELGGNQAHLPVEESVTNLMEIIYNLSEYNNDTFLKFDGDEIPW